jgi:hypothetical protein
MIYGIIYIYISSTLTTFYYKKLYCKTFGKLKKLYYLKMFENDETN